MKARNRPLVDVLPSASLCVYLYALVDRYIGGWVGRQGKAGSAGGRLVARFAR